VKEVVVYKKSVLLALALTFGGGLQAQQPPADASPDPKTQIQELAAVLKETNQELKKCQAEIQQLRGELQQMRLDMAAQNRPAETSAGAEASASSSLEQRVTALEDEQQSLTGKVDEQYQTKVESGSKYRVRFSGLALLNAFSNSGGALDNIEVPNLAFPRRALDSGGNFGATLRQTMFSVQVTGPKLAGAQTSADVSMDFFGGLPSTLDGGVQGVMRLTVARLRFDWANTSLIAGQDSPFISPLSPTSYASLSSPAFGYSGNMWTWTPQVRLEQRWNVKKGVDTALEFGILDPLNGEYPADLFDRNAEAGEKSRHPAFAARNSWKFRLFDRELTLGAGGYFGRQNYGFGRNVTAWAVTGDWNLPLGKSFDLSGEFFRGRALGGLWGGIGSSTVKSGLLADPATQVAGLDVIGGWAQLKWHPLAKLEFNSAFGQDNPFASDLRLFAPTPGVFTPLARNQTLLFNVVHHPRSNLTLSLEYRRLNTRQASGTSADANHVNAAVGVSF
jgi:prefoldin subunit 5